MPSFVINPGSGPVDATSEDNATCNMGVFTDDLRAMGLDVETFIRRQASDYGDGRYAYDVVFGDGRSVEIQMPGLPVEQVRYLGEPQNIWDFPRLYVDDSSWVWKFALSVCEPDDEDA
jgi:hypothetical protein